MGLIRARLDREELDMSVRALFEYSARDRSDLPDPTVVLEPKVKGGPRRRAQDMELLKRFGEAMARPVGLDQSVELQIFEDTEPKPTRRHSGPLSPCTIDGMQTNIAKFAAWSSAPLLDVGLEGQPHPHGPFDIEILRRPVVEFAEWSKARHAARVDPVRHAKEIKKYGDTLAFMTATWNMAFVRHCTRFYNWLEDAGYRPPGSNPLQGIRKHAIIQRLRGEKIIVDAWFKTVLNAMFIPARVAAVVALAANGLRISEIGRLKISDISLESHTLVVDGKGGKVRAFRMYTRTTEALRRWLVERMRTSGTILISPGSDVPVSRTIAGGLLLRAVNKVYKNPADEHIRRALHPHAWRHFFASEALENGAANEWTRAVLGHSSDAMLRRYQHIEHEWMAAQTLRVEARIVEKDSRTPGPKKKPHPLVAAKELEKQEEARARHENLDRLFRSGSPGLWDGTGHSRLSW